MNTQLRIGKRLSRLHLAWAVLSLGVALCLGNAARAADTLVWRTNRVTADIKSGDLLKTLGKIASLTGWQIYLEPGSTHTISTKFRNLPQSEALRLLLGDLSFAVIPETNAHSKLFVFHTTLCNATQLVSAVRTADAGQTNIIPNELIVRLKPGANIDALAKLVGAKVIGKIPGMNAYRLQFDDAAATDAAREQLESQPEVASVENNYSINRPETLQSVSASAPPLNLHMNPPPANGRTVIGLIDTALQPMGNGLDDFVMKQESMAGDPKLDPNSPTHATAMAETMLRTFQLLGYGSSSVNIKPYDIYGPNEAANTFVLAEALSAAASAGANPISMSLGSSADSPLVRDLIQEGSSKGIRFFAAVGNDAGPQMNYPAADSGATPVTALDRNGQLAPYANQSGNAAIGALGTVLVPYNGQTFVVSGTSPATAIVSATAGYLMETGPMTAAQANDQLRKNPTKTTVPGK
jgi:hypothetical protein